MSQLSPLSLVTACAAVHCMAIRIALREIDNGNIDKAKEQLNFAIENHVKTIKELEAQA